MRNFRFILILGILISFSFVFGQQTNQPEKRYIEVSGNVEKEVSPDEIYLRVVLKEYFEGRSKITIKEQEETMINVLKSMGYDIKNIHLQDANTSYTKILWKSDNAVAINTYIIKLSTAEEVKVLLEGIKDLKVYSIDIVKTNYSKFEQLKEEMRTEAIIKAKEKAEKLLTTLGDTLGQTLIITESYNPNYTVTGYGYGNGVSLQRSAGRNIASDRSYSYDQAIEFEPIKISISIYVKFEIK
jgi:uncharacterized protein YggE